MSPVAGAKLAMGGEGVEGSCFAMSEEFASVSTISTYVSDAIDTVPLWRRPALSALKHDESMQFIETSL